MATIDHHDPHAHAPDKRAGFIGLIAGSVALALIMYLIVLWTNARFEGHKASAATPPAAGAPATGH